MDTKDLEQSMRNLIAQALAEDRAKEDITSLACIDKDAQVSAQLVLKTRARIAGLSFLPCILAAMDIKSYRILAQEGSDYDAGKVLAEIEGPARAVLAIERSLLNVIQHTCGIATLTAQFLEAVKGYACAILDTRKTLPGLRAIQKYAVRAAGGKNHRFDLQERVLIKNNHLRILSKNTEDPISTAIANARLISKGAIVQIEVEDVKSLKMALAAAPDAILLDNMSPQQVAQAVECTQRAVHLEASGGITLINARAYAETGVDALSIGALTHSAPAVDISLRM